MKYQATQTWARPLIAVGLLIGCLCAGFVQPARSESLPRSIFYQYIKTLYYATTVKQCSKFWIKNARVPMDECLGTAAVAKLAELKRGYVYKPKIESEVNNGQTCEMKGVGIASFKGQQVTAHLNIIMSFEEGTWKIQYYTWQGEARAGF